jgi:aminoglycoside phosphotransferase (APT) family kinase protein
MSAADDEHVAAQLLRYLSQKYARSDLAYAVKPARIKGGFDASIFGFTLDRPPEALAGPLILRLGQAASDPLRLRLETAVQNALAAMAFPAPHVAVAETNTAPLGGPFMIMERLAGRPLGSDIEGLEQGASLLTKLRSMAGLPALFAKISATWVDAQLRLHELPVEPLLRAVAAAGLDERVVTFEGQRARLAASIESAGLSGLTPGLAWLDANRSDAAPRAVICHGDFHPLNIMAESGRMTGVIDWANVVVAAPEMDVGSALATITAVPIDVPAPLRPLLRVAIKSALTAYLRAYRNKRPLDDRALRYYQVFRALAQLRSAAITIRAGRRGGGAFGSEAGIRSLIAYIDRQSGVKLRA